MNIPKNWDVSNIRFMGGLFSKCKKFNQSLNNWNVSNVEGMIKIFEGASSFDRRNALWYNFS